METPKEEKPPYVVFLIYMYMSDTKLHKNKGKVRRNVIEDVPLDVEKYFDRKCGSIDGKLYKKELKEKEIKREDIDIKTMLP